MTIKRIFTFYIWFALIFYSISFLGSGGVKFRESIPWYVLISRDIVWLGFISYLCYYTKCAPFQIQSWKSGYGRLLKIYTFTCSIYFLIVLIHVTHRELREIIQHDIRNILSYSLIVLFLPFILKKREDIYSLINTLLEAGLVLSLFGITTRYIRPDFFTWQGRIVSTMSDPNNLGIFLVFCILLTISEWKFLGNLKAALYFLLYALALVLTNSVTAFITLSFALTITLLSRKGLIKGCAILLVTLYVFIILSLSVKFIENPGMPWNGFLKKGYNAEKYLYSSLIYKNHEGKIRIFDPDKYMIDKFDNFTSGLFSMVFLFGMDSPTEAYPLHRSLNYRILQAATMFRKAGNDAITENNDTTNGDSEHKKLSYIAEYIHHPLFKEKKEDNEIKKIAKINKSMSLFGNFELKKYVTLDNQYYNFIINTGIISAVIFFGLFISGSIIGLKGYFHLRKTDKRFAFYSFSFSIFLFSMTLIAFNGAAFLNRFPLNFLIYLSLGMIFLIKEMPNDSAHERSI